MISTKSLAERFSDLFDSHPNVYGRTDILEGKNDEGKQNSRSWLQKDPLTLEVWEQHVNGTQPIGCVPIKPDNLVSWGAIDVDTYSGSFNKDELRTKITKHSLPFVLCNSKSGGGHVYIFMKTPILAKLMVAKLAEFAAFFGQGGSEIFPKQTSLRNDNNEADFGNWLNMPYAGPESPRFAQDDAGTTLTQDQFIEYAEARRITPTAFKDLKPPEKDEIFPEGPPCLNYIFSEENENPEMRNIALSNAAVYLKKACPSTWQDELEKCNRLFPTPLKNSEVEAIKKSYERKDYRYQCSQAPLCNHCDSRKCKQQKHGVGKNDIIPSNRSLTVLETEPQIWYLDLEDKRIKLTIDELMNFHLFQRQVLATLKILLPATKQSEWHETVESMISGVTVIEVPEELSAKGQFCTALEDFVNDRRSEDTRSIMTSGVVETREHFFFKMSDLQDWLSRNKHVELPKNEIISAIKEKFEGETKVLRVEGRTAHCWQIPKDRIPDRPETEPYSPASKEAF
jgi:hypothetical protein